MASTSFVCDKESEIRSILSSADENKTTENDFLETIELLQMDADEISDEISCSIEELQGLKQFPCDKCTKVCKSKGALTRHIRSKHSSTRAVSSLGKAKQIPCYMTNENAVTVIKEIGKSLAYAKMYPVDKVTLVSNLKPSESFLVDVNTLLHRFHRKNDRDRFMKDFFSKMYGSWREYFNPCDDHKAVFMMLVHLPERLIALVQDHGPEIHSEQTNTMTDLKTEELGPLAYVAGYVIQALYRKSKNSKDPESERNQEIQALLFSMKVPTEENQYIFSLSRGALWAPNSWLIEIARTAELCFRKNTKSSKSSVLPVDKVVEEVQASSFARSLWSNIVDQCEVEVSKECQSLCFENIIKLYSTVRGFSFARDIVNKYKLKEKTQKTKALRKQLKLDSDQ